MSHFLCSISGVCPCNSIHCILNRLDVSGDISLPNFIIGQVRKCLPCTIKSETIHRQREQNNVETTGSKNKKRVDPRIPKEVKPTVSSDPKRISDSQVSTKGGIIDSDVKPRSSKGTTVKELGTGTRKTKGQDSLSKKSPKKLKQRGIQTGNQPKIPNDNRMEEENDDKVLNLFPQASSGHTERMGKISEDRLDLGGLRCGICGNCGLYGTFNRCTLCQRGKYCGFGYMESAEHPNREGFTEDVEQNLGPSSFNICCDFDEENEWYHEQCCRRCRIGECCYES